MSPHKSPSSDPAECHLLLVDDHADTLIAVGKYLRQCGYVVHTAATFAQALEIALAHPIHVLVTDIGLPDGDGCDLLSEIRATQPVRGLAISGYGMSEDIERCTQAGFEKHLLKPVKPDDLRSAIEHACK
ncbi:MAG TPA: response regulator [Phycisphaerae bacterium]|nr:response regulator [Phycisphaerae bacterium]